MQFAFVWSWIFPMYYHKQANKFTRTWGFSVILDLCPWFSLTNCFAMYWENNVSYSDSNCTYNFSPHISVKLEKPSENLFWTAVFFSNLQYLANRCLFNLNLNRFLEIFLRWFEIIRNRIQKICNNLRQHLLSTKSKMQENFTSYRLQ